MVLPPSLVRKERHASAHPLTAGFVEVLDFLTSDAGFHICSLKMVQLSLLTAGALRAICSSETNSETQVSVHVYYTYHEHDSR